MGDEAAHFDCIDEALRWQHLPAFEGFLWRQSVEGVVKLHCTELARIELEPAMVREIVGVEASPPVVI